MVTFNVDSLDFVDDEEARFGADSDFAARFDSANSRLELEDLTNATVAHVPTGTATDLVGGKFAETVAEGKALADDGNVYDSIQEAENNASSWVKVGPGDFRESVTIDTAGLTLEGSGERTEITDSGTVLTISGSDTTVSNLSVTTIDGLAIDVTAIDATVSNCVCEGGSVNTIIADTDTSILNCEFSGSGSYAIQGKEGTVLANCKIVNANRVMNDLSGEDNMIVAYNTATNIDEIAFGLNASNDGIIIGNRVDSVGGDGISVGGVDNIVANNRVSNTGGDGVQDNGTGTVLDANLTT